MEPEVLADPYPLYRRLRNEDPVHWDPYLHSWVVTRHRDVTTVLQRFVASRTPSAERLSGLGLHYLDPIARVMAKQMLFMDPPAQSRVRRIAAAAFTAKRVELLREHIRDIAKSLLDRVAAAGSMEIMNDFAIPLPAIVTAELFGLPREDYVRLKSWSEEFARMIGSFQHNPERAMYALNSLDEMTAYLRDAVRSQDADSGSGLVHAFATAEVDGDRFSEDEVIANLIITLVGGHETSTNLIGNGLLTLLRHPRDLALLRTTRP